MISNPKASSAIDLHVGGRIRQMRILAGLSQSELGEALGVTFQQIQKYEKGINRIGATRLTQIAQALNTSIDYFFQGLPGTSPIGTGKQDLRTVDLLAQLLDTKEGATFIQGFIQIEDPSARQIVVDLVKHLSKQGVRPASGSTDIGIERAGASGCQGK